MVVRAAAFQGGKRNSLGEHIGQGESEDREGRMMGEYRYRYLGVLLAAVLVALGVLAYLYYERTKPVAKIDLPGVSGEITKEGVDIEVGKQKN